MDENGIVRATRHRRTERLAVALVAALVVATPEPAPACSLTTSGPAIVRAGDVFTLNLSATNTGDGLPTSWTINWGDGSIVTLAGNPATATHTYTAALTPSHFTYNILASAVCGGRRYFQRGLAAASSSNDRVNWYGHSAVTNTAVAGTPAQSGPNGLDFPVDAIIGPDGNLYVSGWFSTNVVRFNPTTGAFIDQFATGGGAATGMTFGPDGHLYVAAYTDGTVRRYNGTTGAFIDLFVTANLGGINQPEDMVFGPDGNLYVTDYLDNNAAGGNAVYRYNGQTGAFIDRFVASGSGGLLRPEELVFGPDGHLYVVSSYQHQVNRYNGTTGAFMGAFVAAGNGLSFPEAGQFGPDGHFYVSSWGENIVKRYNGTTGAFIGNYVSAALGGLSGPYRLAFLPGEQVMVASVTAVELISFDARPGDGRVALAWETGSETKNLGFLVYRALTAEGPYTRITNALIPGLGSSPEGARYSYVDTDVSNGTTYYYKLEDVETTGATRRHGPVSAVPDAGANDGGGDVGHDGPAPGPRVAHGDPTATWLRIVERSDRHMVVELQTGGFHATSLSDGSVRLEVPSFQNDFAKPGQPDIPVRRTWIEALAGANVEIVNVRAEGVRAYALRPGDAPERELVVQRDGTVRLVARHSGRSKRGRPPEADLFPAAYARLLATAFQGDVKKAQLELAPLRYDAARKRLWLARTLTVRLAFQGRADGERTKERGRGRRPPRFSIRQDVLARFAVKDAGLHAVAFEHVFASGARPMGVSQIQLTRLGQPVAFHLEPDNGTFGPGSTLYFVTAGAALNPYGQEAVYELVRSAGSVTMPSADGAPAGAPVATCLHDARFEANRLFQAALVDAPDLWVWDYIVAPATKAYTFSLGNVAQAGSARLTVQLQGGSDYPADPEHHVRIRVNGSLVAEDFWDGKRARTVTADIDASLLRSGENQLEIQNVGDTGAAFSLVMLDRFALRYPGPVAAVAGRLEGTFTSFGTAVAAGTSAASIVDVTDPTPRWLKGAVAGAEGLAFRVEAQRRYLVAAPEAVLRPRLMAPAGASLRSTRNQADYLIVTPREFMSVAQPLLDHRRAQGLSVRAVAVEDIYAEFGFGEKSPHAIRSFLAFAYHEWAAPSPRYVLLLGDATYDPKDFLKTGLQDHIPVFGAKTSFLWTVSDPSYASVNGDDNLPDLALGRLSASSVSEARTLVDKLLAFERTFWTLDGPRVLVADNSDAGGDFERDGDEIAALFGEQAETISIRQLGTGTRSAIRNAFDRGASLISYVGHGSTFIWASENVFSTFDLPTLAPQPRQPLLFTMNCLNGYFHTPGMSTFAEAFVKAEGRGAIAAFAPSGMSVHDAAHTYHKLVLEQLLSKRHTRLGDAILAAQARYASAGAMPELLAIYQLLGDPALVVVTSHR